MTTASTNGARRTGWRARVVVLGGLALLMSAAGLATPVGHDAPSPAVAASPTPSLATVESLYSQDLIARINAERAARNSPFVSLPQLTVDPQLEADAQAWSASIASTGQVADPSLPACDGPSPGVVCLLAANAGNTGYGYWPGDGSDGMDGAYMASADHRQNELNAAYTAVGVGVTCADNQAWTVELFGEAYGDVPQANAREAAQDDTQGDPVPQSPVVAGAPSGDPVYCPGQTVGPDGAVTATGGQYAYPFAVPAVPGEPNGALDSPVVGMAATSDGLGYWLVRANGAVTPYGDAVSYGEMSNVPLNAPITHIVATSDGHGYWLVAADGGIFSFGDAHFYGSMGGRPLNAPVVDMAPTPNGQGYWLVGSDGGVFAFGDAPFYGSMGGRPLNKPVVGMAGDPAPAVTGWWRRMAASSPTAPTSTARPGACGSTSRSTRWRPLPTVPATGSWPPTAASSVSATPALTAVPATSSWPHLSWAWPPTLPPAATGWWARTAACSPTAPRSSARAEPFEPFEPLEPSGSGAALSSTR